MYRDVEEFRYKMGFTGTVGPARQTGKLVEEASELLEALFTNDDAGILDGLVDCLYVILGVAVAANVTPEALEAMWQRVQASNMTKTPDGTLSPRGEDYKPPSEVE